MAVPIQLGGVASGPLGLASLFQAVSLGYEGGHKPVTVIFWAVLGLGLVGAAALYWLWVYRQKRSNGTDTNVNGAPDPCGAPKARRKLMAQGAEQLAHNLAEFEVWWPAVENPDFNDRLVSKDGKKGHHINHAQAMQTLLHKFAQFFSAQYTYQRQCHDHRPLKSVKKVYGALTDDPGGPDDSDYALMSNQLHDVGKRSTSGWGTVDARPLELDEFQSALENDPQFAERFKPLEEFLLAAAPNTEARARLEATAKAVRRVEERLDPNVLRRAFRPLSRSWVRAKAKVGNQP